MQASKRSWYDAASTRHQFKVAFYRLQLYQYSSKPGVWTAECLVLHSHTMQPLERIWVATFAQEEMRHHLMQCFEARKLMPFPEESKKVHKCRKKHLFISLYRTCRLSESYDSDMIYHVMDVGNGSTSDVCIFKHHLLRHGFVHIAYSIIFPCELAVYIHFCCCISNYLLESFTSRCQ